MVDAAQNPLTRVNQTPNTIRNCETFTTTHTRFIFTLIVIPIGTTTLSQWRVLFSGFSRIYLQLRNRVRWFAAKGASHQGQKHRFRGQAFSTERLGRREPRSAEYTEGKLRSHEFNRRHEPLSGHHPHVQL